MDIKKIYEIKEETKLGETKILRCKSVKQVIEEDGYGILRTYDDYYAKETRACFVILETNIKYTLINKEAKIIQDGIPTTVTKIKVTQSFIIYLDNKYIIAIGSRTNYKLKGSINILANNTNNIETILGNSWVQMENDYVYCLFNLLIIKKTERLDIYYADDLDTMQQIKLNSENVIARCQETDDNLIIHICELDENMFPHKEYFFSANNGKQMAVEFKEI